MVLLSVLILPPESAVAAEAEVTIVRLDKCCAASAWPAAEERIEKELAISNLTVTAEHPPAGDIPAWRQLLESALNRTAAKGAILVAVTPDEGVVLHTLFNGSTENGSNIDATEYRHQSLAATPRNDAIEVVAIKTKEAVLAALYQRTTSEEKSPKKQNRETLKKPSARVSNRTKPDSQYIQRRLSLAGLFGAAWARGGIGPSGCAAAAVTLHPADRFSFGVRGDISVLNKDIKTTNASASVNLMLGRIQTAYLFTGLGPMFTRVGIHVGVGQLHSDGKSDDLPVRNTSATFLFGGLFGAFSFRINKRIYIPFTLGISALPRTIDIRFSQKTEASIKTLLLEAGIGAALML